MADPAPKPSRLGDIRWQVGTVGVVLLAISLSTRAWVYAITTVVFVSIFLGCVSCS